MHLFRFLLSTFSSFACVCQTALPERGRWLKQARKEKLAFVKTSKACCFGTCQRASPCTFWLTEVCLKTAEDKQFIQALPSCDQRWSHCWGGWMGDWGPSQLRALGKAWTGLCIGGSGYLWGQGSWWGGCGWVLYWSECRCWLNVGKQSWRGLPLGGCGAQPLSSEGGCLEPAAGCCPPSAGTSHSSQGPALGTWGHTDGTRPPLWRKVGPAESWLCSRCPAPAAPLAGSSKGKWEESLRLGYIDL